MTPVKLFLVLLFPLCFAGAQPLRPQAVDSSNYIADRIVKSEIPVLVDFWAVWCGPCKLLNPIIKELEKEYRGRVDFIKVNVDVHRQIANYFKVQAIPSIFLIYDKAVIQVIPGLRAKEDYRAALNAALALARKKSVPDTTRSDE